MRCSGLAEEADLEGSTAAPVWLKTVTRHDISSAARIGTAFVAWHAVPDPHFAYCCTFGSLVEIVTW